MSTSATILTTDNTATATPCTGADGPPNLEGWAGTLQRTLTEDGLQTVLNAETSHLGAIVETLHEQHSEAHKQTAKEFPKHSKFIKQWGAASRDDLRQGVMELRKAYGVEETTEDENTVTILLNSPVPSVSEIRQALKNVEQRGRWWADLDPATGETRHGYHENKNQAVIYSINRTRSVAAEQNGNGRSGYRRVGGLYRSHLKTHGTTENKVLGIDTNAKAKAKAKAREAEVEAAPLSVETMPALVDRIHKGNISPDEFKQSFIQFQESTKALEISLGKNSKAALAELCGSHIDRLRSGVTKSDLVGHVIKRWRGVFRIDHVIPDPMNREEQIGSGFGTQIGLPVVLSEWVESTTAEDIAHNAEQRRQRMERLQEERAAEEAAANKMLTNPETLEEFRENQKDPGRSYLDLTPAQRVRWDELEAEQSLEKRRERLNTQRTVESFQGEGAALSFNLSTNYHSKRECDIYTATASGRVDTDSFREMQRKAKQLGGWYYRTFRGTPGTSATHIM